MSGNDNPSQAFTAKHVPYPQLTTTMPALMNSLNSCSIVRHQLPEDHELNRILSFFSNKPSWIYSMVDESSDELKLFLSRKKLTFKLFFYFFLRHSKKFGDFFAKSVEFLLQNHWNLLKITQISRRQPASRFLFFIFFLRQRKNTSVGIRRP